MDSGSGLVSVVPSGSETISGRAAVTLTHQYQVSSFISDGVNWQVKSFGGLSLRLGAYGTPVPDSTVGICNMYALNNTASSIGLVGFWLIRGTGTGASICWQGLIESETTVTGPASLTCVDALVGLTQTTSRLATAADHTSGMFAGHFKVYSVDGATVASGARAAAVWLDGQMNGANASPVAANYYAIYNTSGGNKYEAFAKLHLISGEGAGWRTLFEFNFTNGTDPLVANTVFVAPDTVSPVGGIRIDDNGTDRYIPFYAAA